MIRLARILNNTHNWEKPSGTQRVAGFPELYGFGYEEWLNSSYLKTSRYRFGFLQALYKRVPREEFSKVFLYTYNNNTYKIEGVVYNLQYIPIKDRDAIERQLIIGNKDAFQNEIITVGGILPQNNTDSRFKVNFSIGKQADLILNAKKAVEIKYNDYPALYTYFQRSKFYRLSVLYKLDGPHIEEIAEMLRIEKLLVKDRA